MKWCPQDCETEARLTKRIAELEAALREPMRKGVRSDKIDDKFIFISLEELREDVAAVLAEYFSPSNATGLELRQYEIDWLVGGIVERAKQRLENRGSR